MIRAHADVPARREVDAEHEGDGETLARDAARARAVRKRQAGPEPGNDAASENAQVQPDGGFVWIFVQIPAFFRAYRFSTARLNYQCALRFGTTTFCQGSILRHARSFFARDVLAAEDLAKRLGGSMQRKMMVYMLLVFGAFMFGLPLRPHPLTCW